MRRTPFPPADPSDQPDEPDDETSEETVGRKRDVPRESHDRMAARNGPRMVDRERRGAPGESGEPHEPAVGLDDPRVSAVPDTTPRPDENEAQAAARLRRGGQNAWGSPEDQPDHDRNEVYVQQDATLS
jgi:hypothetical protein